MNNFKNHFKRSRYKSNGERNFRKRNGNGHKINGEFNNGIEFKRKNPGRNNQNAAKLIEKYNELAREALSNGDKILSENYLQHSDHFSRVINSQEILKSQNSQSTQSINREEKENNNKSEKENIKDKDNSNQLNTND